ncbi:hypothetical protein BCR32DRAFT_297784 [Anaeromyces robustus]|uniref:SUEL-type lectin domain-containing protein n=1 Tax=Anaeromyces robustus TaxID=1754192 RepID=A0A1Y1VVB8_9FUNG|nr:hypothetical protein BCR32DRAFT_297784 [Anaeromyces robustus]|eukprot:ORX65230.1 hypothetical protein BCR32DRAFT_297784 [Anaeromyces robustus]
MLINEIIWLLIVFPLIINSKNIDENSEENYNELPKDFIYLDPNNVNGPLTINRTEDDGTKRNLFSFIHHEEKIKSITEEEFRNMKNETEKKSEYICEMYGVNRPEGMKGHEISCPPHYNLVIDKAFYGRYVNDTTHCPIKNLTPEIKEKIKFNDCGKEYLKNIKGKCEGRNYCSIFVSNYFYKDSCKGVYKYLNVDYHCIKEPELKEEKIAIVMFRDSITSNSIDENSVSEFYQYAKIHGYDFYYETYNYIPYRSIFFMKLFSIIERMIEGLKQKKYDWIFWVDTDTMIMNPNIRLETFLPNEKMPKIHFIAGFGERGGFQAGVFFIRVHEWSLNMLMRSISYSYYYPNRYIPFDDQSSMNNVLTDKSVDESDNYIIVPPKWFNNNRYKIEKGDFLLHVMGDYGRKSQIASEFRNRIKNDNEWYNKTNAQMRQEVLEYYNLPKDKQIHIKYQ